MSLATITVSGFLGKDAELRYSRNGQPILSFSVAVDGTEDAQGERSTDWFRCTMFGARGEKLQLYLVKGTSVVATGRFSTREFVGNDGVKRLNLEIVVSELDFTSKKENTGGQPATTTGRKGSPGVVLDDADLPF